MENLRISDLNEGANEVDLTSLFLKRIFSAQMYMDKSLERMMPTMAEMTSQTGREVSAVVYVKVPRDLKRAKSIRSTVLTFPDFRIIPSLGDFESVQEPEFFNSPLYREWIKKKKMKEN